MWKSCTLTLPWNWRRHGTTLRHKYAYVWYSKHCPIRKDHNCKETCFSFRLSQNERAGAAVSFYTCIREVHTAYLDCGFSCSSPVLPHIWRESTSIRPWPHTFRYFTIHQSLYHSKLYCGDWQYRKQKRIFQKGIIIGTIKILCFWTLSIVLTDYALCHKGVWGSGCIDLRIDLGTSWRWVVRFMQRLLYPRRKNTPPPGTHWIRGWVGPRTGLDDVEKRKFLTILGLELRPHGRPARSQSLYRLRYPGSSVVIKLSLI
jgi:hypothetical protein